MTEIDISDEMQKLARNLNPECEYISGDMRDLSLPVFDLVVNIDSICSMQNLSGLTKAFRTTCDHLKQGGLFLTLIEY